MNIAGTGLELSVVGQRGAGERGSTLLLGMITLTMITLLVVSVFNLSSFESTMTAGEIGAVNALYVAEVGVHTAITDMQDNYAMIAADTDLTDNVAALPGPNIATGPLSGFRQLYGPTPYLSVSSGVTVGTYQVGVKIDPTSVLTVIVRSVGVGTSGTTRIVEAVVSTSP